jgi:hypothetical protein
MGAKLLLTGRRVAQKERSEQSASCAAARAAIYGTCEFESRQLTLPGDCLRKMPARVPRLVTGCVT